MRSERNLNSTVSDYLSNTFVHCYAEEWDLAILLDRVFGRGRRFTGSTDSLKDLIDERIAAHAQNRQESHRSKRGILKRPTASDKGIARQSRQFSTAKD
jgi:hypothetical protein